MSQANDSANSDKQPLIEEYQQGTRVYKTRWWILMVFSLACMTQASVWNTWGPVAESVEVVFEWSDGLVAFFPTLGNIAFLILVIPGSSVMDTKGLRISMIVSSAMMVTCTAIRCFTLDRYVFTVLAYISTVLQGIAGIVPFAGPSLVAAVWFPVNERPTATAIGTFLRYFGLSMSFIVGPQLVPGPIYESTFNNSSSNYTSSNTRQLDDVMNLHELKSGISYYMYTHVGLSIFQFALVLIHFPAKPPRPPSITASIQRTDYKQALQRLIRNGPLWVISVAGSLQVGLAGTWISVIDVIIKAIGVSQIDAGWMGFVNTVIGCISGIIIAKYSYRFHRRRKQFLSVSFVCAILCAVWFSLICDSVIAFSLPSLYISSFLLGIFINGPIPLFIEMAAETSYPVGEGVTGGFFSALSTIFGIVFLAFIAIPNIGITWINWTVPGSLCVSIALLMVFPERYRRSDIDMNVENKQ